MINYRADAYKPAAIGRRSFAACALGGLAARAGIPDRVVVLTLDDAVKSHRTFAGPLLKDLGFGATFFVSHGFMPDTEHFMTWSEIAELHAMGFEVGNHSWTHPDFSQPRVAARLAGELALVENELKKVGVPRPVSFAYSGNGFGPEAVAELERAGYRFARRGKMPEAPYGKAIVGATFDPGRHHRLLIPTTGDAYPNWTLTHFQEVVSHATNGRIVVLQFHGVPDLAHPWVHTPPENFEQYMRYLKAQNFRVIALRDLAPYLPPNDPPDPLLKDRSPHPDKPLQLPVEVETTRSDLRYWLPNMITDHKYSPAEAAKVCGLAEEEIVRKTAALPVETKPPRIRPYPGGRLLRLAFNEGAINPLRGTKATVFLPWDAESYVVVDLAEAIFSSAGLLFLAHTHVPTIWNEKNVVIENVDWRRDAGLTSEWKLPNEVSFGATIQPADDHVEMGLWLRNGTTEPLSKLRTQICVLLKGAAGFNQQTNANKTYDKGMASVRSNNGSHSIFTEWERCGRTWGNPQCPCMHSDPVLPDCAPGQTVRVRGKLWFG